MQQAFTIEHLCQNARAGRFYTRNGSFETPAFMPVGTRGTVKGLDCERLKQVGTQIALVNTYHLWLRPGQQLVKDMGGIHSFMNWRGPILSDSGGYQVFSLKSIRRITEEGVEFRSHLDGNLCFLSPELSIQIQSDLGVDIAMALDECLPGDSDLTRAKESLAMTLRWAKRSLAARHNPHMALFGITQGGKYKELRAQAAHELALLPYDGYAIGGLSVGEPKEIMYEVLNYHVKELPPQHIHYLMGVGTPEDIVQAVSEGIDLFDCVMPTRAGRFGRLFIRGPQPFINIRNAQFERAEESIDPSCTCVACRNYSRAYIHYLFKVGEMLGPQLASIHNLTHYLDLMREIRQSIKLNNFQGFYRREKERWKNCSE